MERAQQKVEARNFDIRKTLLKFDDVLNDQRHVIFNQRREVLEKQNVFETIDNFLKNEIEDLIKQREKSPTFFENKAHANRINTLFGEKDNLDEKFKSLSDKEITNSINSNIKKKREERSAFLGEEGSKEIEKKIFLQLIDLNWKNHIQYLEQLRQVIGLRSYGQRDPLVEYKKEAFHSFETLLNKIRQDIVMILLNLKIVEKRK